jgi:malate permease and related proteins
MTDILLQAYTPLVCWIGLGVVILRFLPASLPRLLGRGLYWLGLPIQIFALARQTDFSHLTVLAPVYTLIILVVGLGAGWLGQYWLHRPSVEVGLDNLPEKPAPFQPNPIAHRDRQGSFILSAMLGNTGLVGIAIASTLISPDNMVWAIVYTVTQNIFGSFGLGVFVASYFGRPTAHWWHHLRDVLTVPTLWGFGLGWLSQRLSFPAPVDIALAQSVWVVIPIAFILTGMRLSQLPGWQSLRLGLLPGLLKVLLLPIVMGLITTATGLTGEPRLALVLMAGMPTAFAALILAEEYDLDRQLPTSAIALSTVGILLLLPFWLWMFR